METYKNNYRAGDKVMTADKERFPGVVLKVCEWSEGEEQALEVRLPGGVAMRCASDLIPAGGDSCR